MSKSDWIWMPHAGHFILSDKCRFHLNTYLPSGYIVSTVGELWNERAVRDIHAEVVDPIWYGENRDFKGDIYDAAFMKKFGFQDIGYNRKYETMVFKAKKNHDPKWQCCPYEAVIGQDVDMDGYNTGVEAFKGHTEMCEKWEKELLVTPEQERGE